jgi:hypothetical protein
MCKIDFEVSMLKQFPPQKNKIGNLFESNMLWTNSIKGFFFT